MGVYQSRLYGSLQLALLFVLTGCGYYTESERAYFEGKEAEQQRQQSQRDVLVAILPDEEVLGLVYDSDAPTGDQKTKSWIERELQTRNGQALFPQWNVSRRGANNYEVRFTYTYIDTSNQLARQGYSWSVNSALKLVSPPTTLALAAPTRIGRTLDQQSGQRIKDEEESLE